MIPSLALLLLAAATAPAYATSSITATGSVTNLALDGGGSSTSHIVKVADLTMSTDAGLGFTVLISSGSLTKPGGAPIPFKVALVDDGAAPPPSNAFTTASGMSITFATATSGSVLKDLYILYLSANVQDPGDYSASIVCDITDN